MSYVDTPRVTTFTVLALEDTTQYPYEFSVAARTIAGEGVFSEPAIHESEGGSAVCAAASAVVSEVTAASAKVQAVPPSFVDLNGNEVDTITVTVTAIEDSNGAAIVGAVPAKVTFAASDGFDAVKSVTGLSAYTVYRVEAALATTSGAEAPEAEAYTFRTEEGVPGAMDAESLVAQEIGNRISVIWTEPAPANGQLTYEVTVEPAIDGVSTFSTTQRRINITDALTGTAYTISVAASTSAGTGDAATTDVDTAVSNVDAPAVEVVSKEEDALVLRATWTAGGLTAFAVTYDKVGGPRAWSEEETVSVDVGSGSTEFTLSGLEHSTQYDVRVQAEDEEGRGQTEQFQFTTAIRPPVTPSGLTASAVSSSSIEASWAPLAPSGGLDTVRGYRVALYQGEALADQVDAGAESSVTFDGLSPVTRYGVAVLAYNDGGSSALSEQVEVISLASECADDEYESVSPDLEAGVDRVCEKCEECPEGYYISAACSAGEGTTCSKCNTTCPEGQWMSQVCGATTNIECSDCRVCDNSTEILVSECSEFENTICEPIPT